MTRRFLFLLGSSRDGGNTELLARRAAASLPPDAEARWLRLAELPLEPFVDVRHSGGAYAMPTGHARTLLDATLWATDLVVAAPTYWYGLPAAAKLYLDHWSGWLRVPGLDFKARMAGRALWTITVNADEPGEDEGGSALLLQGMDRSAAYMGMRSAGALVGHGSRPGDALRDAAALAAADVLFARALPERAPAAGDVPARRLVELRTYALRPGSGPVFHALVSERSAPLLRAWGTDVVAHGPSVHDPDAYLLVRAYRDLEHLRASQDEFYASDAWRKGPRQAIVELIVSDANAVLWLPVAAVEALRGG